MKEIRKRVEKNITKEVDFSRFKDVESKDKRKHLKPKTLEGMMMKNILEAIFEDNEELDNNNINNYNKNMENMKITNEEYKTIKDELPKLREDLLIKMKILIINIEESLMEVEELINEIDNKSKIEE